MRRERNFRHNWNADASDNIRHQNKQFDKFKDARAQKRLKRRKSQKIKKSQCVQKNNKYTAPPDANQSFVRNPFVDKEPNRINNNDDFRRNEIKINVNGGCEPYNRSHVEPVFQRSHNQIRSRSTISPHANNLHNFSFVAHNDTPDRLTNHHDNIFSRTSAAFPRSRYNECHSTPPTLDFRIKHEPAEDIDPPAPKLAIKPLMSLVIPDDVLLSPEIGKSPNKRKRTSTATEINETELPPPAQSPNKRKSTAVALAQQDLQADFDIRISKSTNATQTEQPAAKKPRKKKSGQNVCQLCDVNGHTEIQCLMICKNCNVPYHNMRTCPLPNQSQKTLSTFLEFCIKQFIDSEKN